MARSAVIRSHQAELVEDDGDDDGDEELEEALDPQMDDPESPGIGDRVVGRSIEEQRREIEDGNSGRCDQEEGDQAAPFGVAPRRRQVAPQQPEPEDQADGQQDLPGAAELEEFPALIAEPEPERTEPLQQAGPFAQQAADGDHDDGDKEQVDAQSLPGGFGSAEHARHVKRAADIGRRDPENRQLQMPGSQQVAGQVCGKVDAVEIARLGPVVRHGAADQRLSDEEQCGNRHEFERCQLSGRRRQGRSGRHNRIRPMPAQIVELAECQQHNRRPAEQEDQADGAVDQGSGCGRVAGQRIIGKVVRVGV